MEGQSGDETDDALRNSFGNGHEVRVRQRGQASESENTARQGFNLAGIAHGI